MFYCSFHLDTAMTSDAAATASQYSYSDFDFTDTQAAQGFPQYIVVQSSTDDATFWYNMYVALFCHLLLLAAYLPQAE